MDHHNRSINFPMAGILVAIAAALGFSVAHWLDGRKPTATAPVQIAVETPKGSSEIKIPAEYIKLAQIAVEAVGNGGVNSEILSFGRVTVSPNNEAIIVARAAGNIARLHHQLGDAVRAGEMLAEVNSMEAAGLAADASAAAARLGLARSTYQREATLHEQGVSPRQDLEAAKSALNIAESEAQRTAVIAKAAQVSKDGRSVAVISPIEGKITAMTATLGGYVQPQTELFHVIGYGPKQVEAPLLATDIGRVRAGDKGTIIAAGGMPISVTVRGITSAVNSSTGSATAILTTDAGADALIAGEGVQVRLHSKGQSAGLFVPEEAVQNIDGRDVLFVRTKDGFKPQPVLIGERSGGTAQIVSGVRAGELVATRNAFLVKADMIKSAKEE